MSFGKSIALLAAGVMLTTGAQKGGWYASVSFLVNDTLEAFGEYTYRASEGMKTDNALFSGTLDIRNT